MLIVDEAQNLGDEVLEEIRMLTNLETHTEKLAPDRFSGSARTRAEAEAAEPAAITSAADAACQRRILSPRWKKPKLISGSGYAFAGSDGQQIFDPESVVLIHRYANGIPRIINLLCEHCLVSAFVDQQKVILPAVVDAVAQEFDLVEGMAAEAMTEGPSTTSPKKLT